MGLTPEEKKLYSQLFKALDTENSGIVTGEKARTTFEKSGLPPNILGEIWQLADQNNVGFLTQFGFCVAMRLIGYTQSGKFPSANIADEPGPLPKFSGLGFAPPGAPHAALHPQLTSNSLIQSQPSAIVPQNTATQQLQPLDPIGPVNPVDYERFKNMFVKTTGSESTPLEGASARDILMKAKLPTPTLGQVWSLVDIHNRGSLDLNSFVMAMHLIHGLISGKIKQLPPFLPEFVWQSVDSARVASSSQANRQVSQASTSSQLSTIRHTPSQQAQVAPSDSEWSVSPQQKQTFDAMFDNLDTQKSGKLNPDQVASFLMTSRLGQQDLATIWDLSDIQNTGVFTKLEFGIALFLVNRKRAGLSLPNIVPDALIKSLSGSTQPAQNLSPQKEAAPPTQPYGSQQQQPISAPHRSKSSMDELADIFGPSPQPLPRVTSPVSRPPLQQHASSSDLTPNDLPKVRKQLSSSFKPTSSFGQNLLSHQLPSHAKEATTLPPVQEPPNLIGDDVPNHSPAQSPAPVAREVTSPGSSQPHNQAQTQPQQPEVQKQRTVDYEALRSVPPPPPKNRGEPSGQGSSYFPEVLSPTKAGSPAPRNTSADRAVSQNNDLLADSEVSGQLSQANTDIANTSNQVKSLTAQTSSLHEKKTLADRELSRIMTVKEEIDNKLKLLRASYSNEVKQVEQVEKTLTNAKEETEALRSEASISEAKLNSLSGELHEKQVAVEELEKTNSGLREKLGYLNAEIVELQKTLEAKTAENTKLTKDSNVRKSQVQVAIVKVDELKNAIAQVEASNSRLIEEISQNEQKKASAESEAKNLQDHHDQLSKQGPPQASSQSLSHGFGSALSAAAGAAAGGLAGIAGGEVLSKHHDGHETVGEAKEIRSEEPRESEESQSKATDSNNFLLSVHDEPQVHQRVHQRDVPSRPQEQSQADSQVIPGSLAFEDNSSSGPSTTAPQQQGGDGVSGLVDEVLDKPSGDMTGIDDFANAEHKPSEGDQPKEGFESSTQNYEPQSMEAIKQRFPEPYESATDRTVPSSEVTDLYKPSDSVRSETPVTSPNNSEYQFQPSSGVVGGMTGMPSVLFGVQRTDSLTSSIQNNPSLSVRDDNIDEVSEHETLSGNTANSPTNANRTTRPTKEGEGREESSEGERISSGVELFEIVNADEARGLDSRHTLEEQTAAGNSANADPTCHQAVPAPANDEEFPPIRELHYEESSSSDEEGPEDKFDDAVDHMNNSQPQGTAQGVSQDDSRDISQTQPKDEFDFDEDLKPATQEQATASSNRDAFDDEFDDLQVAGADNDDFDDQEVEPQLDDHYTGADGPTSYSVPTFAGATSNFQPDDNDEWEKLFAGFGNAAPAQAEPSAKGSEPANATSGASDAISELVGMGFDEKTATEALKKENWNLEAATNYLLDHA